MTELIIVGDEAWTAEDWAAEERRRAKDRAKSRAFYAAHPEVSRARTQQWRERNRDRWRAYNREYMRARRAQQRYGGIPVASLHELRCTGPTKRTGCRCQKIPMFLKETA